MRELLLHEWRYFCDAFTEEQKRVAFNSELVGVGRVACRIGWCPLIRKRGELKAVDAQGRALKAARFNQMSLGRIYKNTSRSQVANNELKRYLVYEEVM